MQRSANMRLTIVAVLSFALLGAACSSHPFDPGQTKQQLPYPEGVWLGPKSTEDYERELLAEEKADSPVVRRWERLKEQIVAGDELWEFAASPYVVDGGPRYFGVALVRSGRIVVSVVTKVIE